MSSNSTEELAALIAELRAKLPADATIELIDDAAPATTAEQLAAEQWRDDLVPSELAQMVEAAAKELGIQDIKAIPMPLMKISAIDESDEAQQAMAAVRDKAQQSGVAMLRASCYHYILDSNGQPVPCEDKERVQRFEKRHGDVVAEVNFRCDDLTMKVITTFAVHNPQLGNEPPQPTWVTSVVCMNTGELGLQLSTQDRRKVHAMHRDVCEQTRKACGRLHRQRRPSPRRAKVAQRLISEGRNVLTGKPVDHTALIQRVLRATVGSEAHTDV